MSKESNESKKSKESKIGEDQDWSWLEDKVVPKESIKSKFAEDKVENQIEVLKPKTFNIETNKDPDHNNAASEDSIDSKADIDVENEFKNPIHQNLDMSFEKKLNTASKISLKTDSDENLEIISRENFNKAPKNYLNKDSQQVIDNFDRELLSDSKKNQIKPFKEDTAVNENLNEVEKMEDKESGNIVSG